jgi:ribosomal protein S25
MFLKDPDEKSGLQKAIDDLLVEMEKINKDSDEYAKMADQLVKLYNLKEVDSKRKVSPDTLATVLGNLIGIALIIRHERENVLTSKALTFVQKLIR